MPGRNSTLVYVQWHSAVYDQGANEATSIVCQLSREEKVKLEFGNKVLSPDWSIQVMMKIQGARSNEESLFHSSVENM